MPNFCLFIPSSKNSVDSANIDELAHEKNSIQILNHSCVKNNKSLLEFEIKTKNENQQKTKYKVSGNQATASDVDDLDDSSETSEQNQKKFTLVNFI